MLTQEQINEIRIKSGLEPFDELINQPTINKNFVGRFNFLKKEPGYLERIKQDYKKSAENIISETQQSAQEISKNIGKTGYIPQAKVAGRLLETGLRTAGEVSGLAFTPITEFPGMKKLTEFLIKNTTVAGIKAEDIIKKIGEFTQKYPEAAKDLNSVLNISLVKGVKTIEPSIKDITSSITKTSVKTGEKIITPGIDIVKGAGQYVSSRTPKLLSIFSGENMNTIANALKDTTKADIGIKGGDIALRNAVQEAGKNSIKIKNAFIKSYSDAKNKALGNYSSVLIPKSNVIGDFYKILQSYGVKIKNGILDFTTSDIKANPGEISKINSALESLRNWDKFTISSIDDFKHHIGKLTKFATEAGGSSKSPVLGTFYHRIDRIIKTKLPEDLKIKYTNLNKKFSESIKLMDDMVDAFNSGDPFTKLANALGNNKDSLRQIIEFYEKKSKDNILSVVAGRELGAERQAAFGFLNPRSWIDFFISPKVQGKIITTIGNKLKRIK